MIARFAGHTSCDIQPCHSDEFPSPVTRPAYSVLDKTKLKETFGVKIPYWLDSLLVCMRNMKEVFFDRISGLNVLFFKEKCGGE